MSTCFLFECEARSRRKSGTYMALDVARSLLMITTVLIQSPLKLALASLVCRLLNSWEQEILPYTCLVTSELILFLSFWVTSKSATQLVPM